MFLFYFIVFTVLVALVLASLLVTNGIYGEPAELGVGVCFLIIIQVHKMKTTLKIYVFAIFKKNIMSDFHVS